MTHTDLIARLRDHAPHVVRREDGDGTAVPFAADLYHAAAGLTAAQERIEALEGALSRIDVGHGWAAQIARAALNDAGKGEG